MENVTGAGGVIATNRVAKAAPDGYTLLMGGNSALALSPSLYDKLSYDPVRNFATDLTSLHRGESAHDPSVMRGMG